MNHPISRKDQLSLLFVTAILLMAGPSSGSPNYRPSRQSLFAGLHSSCYFLSDTPGNALLRKRPNGASRLVRTARNGDLVIAIPDAGKTNYRIRFFDADSHFLFEIGKLEDPMLIIEKYNFLHAGTFQYELYKGGTLMERNSFQIKKD